MRFEHVALNVPDAVAMAAWYVEHCGMRVIRGSEEPPYAHFVADRTGRTILELYTNSTATIPDYPKQHALCLHIAFAVENGALTRDRLVAAGASVDSDQHLGDGTHLVMLRDPWGMPLQLCQRTSPMP
jgi:glyoxylase I family protein